MQTTYFDHPSNYSSSWYKLESMGLASGFPNQFHFREVNHHGNHSSKESVEIHINDDVNVRQRSQENPLTGEQEDMVPDFPFDPVYDNKINQRLLLTGFGALAMGALLL